MGYHDYKDKKLLFFGITLLFISNPFWPVAINFFYINFLGDPIPIQVYLFIGYGFAFAVLAWLFVFTEMVATKRKKLIIMSFLVYEIIFEIIFIALLFYNTRLLGYYSNDTVRMGIVLAIHSIINLTIPLITWIKMYFEVNRASSPEIRLKGKLFLTGMIMYFIGAIFYAITALSFVAAFIYIAAITCAYGGLIFPQWMKKLLLKEN